jgi:ATP synthase protein I
MMITASVRRTALLVVPVVLVGGSWLLDGNRGAAGAALGVAMVTLFFAGGRAPMLLADSTPAGPLFLLIAMGYVLRVLLLLVVLLAFGDAGWVDRAAVAAAVLTCALLWTVSLVHRHLTSRQPTLVIEPTPLPQRVGALR